MKISSIIDVVQKPLLYEKSPLQMWTDPYIGEQLLSIHLNPETHLASRKPSVIKSTSDWILSNFSQKPLKILDLGCGPGLYDVIFASKGHVVTGIDFSPVSIEYANKYAQKNELSINYFLQNYLNFVSENEFDLIIMIYTDFGVLLPHERNVLLNNVYKSLKPGGLFIFDIINEKNIEKKLGNRDWDISFNGFWSDLPYLALSETYHYSENCVFLNQHNIIQDKVIKTYRFWIHYFSDNHLLNVLEPNQFKNIRFYYDILPEEDIWSGKNITFVKCQK